MISTREKIEIHERAVNEMAKLCSDIVYKKTNSQPTVEQITYKSSKFTKFTTLSGKVFAIAVQTRNCTSTKYPDIYIDKPTIHKMALLAKMMRCEVRLLVLFEDGKIIVIDPMRDEYTISSEQVLPKRTFTNAIDKTLTNKIVHKYSKKPSKQTFDASWVYKGTREQTNDNNPKLF